MEYRVPKKRKPKSPPTAVTEDARVQRSRENLRAAFLRLLIAAPLDQITVRDITAAANVGYTTFFRLYESKDALLNDIAAEEIAHLCDLCAPIYDATNAQAACLALCVYVDERRTLWTALMSGGGAFVREELLRQGKLTSKSRARGALPDDLGVTLASAVMFEVLAWWLRQKRPMPAEAVAEILDRTAIAPTEGARKRKAKSAARRRAP